MIKKFCIRLSVSIIAISCSLNGTWYALSPVVTAANTSPEETVSAITSLLKKEKAIQEPYVLVNLKAMTVTLKGTSTEEITLPILSQGKPGSFYETIGGDYRSDWKEVVHFSTLGHVYMPYSVHLFGNFFIHGIPYYPDGTKVSSLYSGGCVRLADEDAKKVYDFIQKGTRIIVTQSNALAFYPTVPNNKTLQHLDTTLYMTAIISLETLNQNETIYTTDEQKETARKKLLPLLLLKKDTTASKLILQNKDKAVFVEQMNQKAKVLGMTNTVFADTESQATTTEEDIKRLNDYIVTYKTYLTTLTLSTSTEPSL